MTTPTLERPGVWRVPSSRNTGDAYTVQIQGGRGACDCVGSNYSSQPCRHVRDVLALAKEQNIVTTETAPTTAVAVREAEVYSPMVVDPPASMYPTRDEMGVMVTIANSIYKTSGKLIPSNIKTSEEAFAVMLAGRELGIPPMAAFREVYVVNGRTMPSARVLMGLVQKGDPGAIFTWLDRSATKAHVRLRRSNGQTIEVEYTIEDAKVAGLLKNEVWTRFPKDMLAYKAVTRACRLGGADLITGIGASVKGAPQVMQAIEEDGRDEGDEIPQLTGEPLPPEQEPVVDKKARIVELLQEAQERWQDEDGKYEAWSNGIRERFPVLNDPKKIAKLSDDDAAAIVEAIEADVLGVVQGSFSA